MRLRCICLLATLVTAPSSSALGMRQNGQFTPERSLGTEARVALANVALGAATVGIYRLVRGDLSLGALRDGALGGAIAYGGKRLTVERFAGAGFAGREIGAVGHSIIRNASDGRPILERLVLPFGPVRLYVRPDSQSRARVRVDLPTVIYALLLGANGNSLDLPATLSSGVLVFKVSGYPLADISGQCVGGLAFNGLVLMDDMSGLGASKRNPSFAHERVHVGQFDQLFLTASDPFEEWLAPRVPGGMGFKRYFDLNVMSPVLLVPGLALKWEERPWEQEATNLTRQAFGDAPSPNADTYWWGCG